MKAAIYNPYLDTLGGGERYSMAFASVLVKMGYRVDVEWKKKSIKEKLEKRFGIQLSQINFVIDVKRGDGYDICFWVSDGSIPALKARRNYIHFQIPFRNVNGKSLLNRMKFSRIEKVICNSKFTKKFIDEEYGVDSTVLYPPVDVENIKSRRKENFILSVGRFSQLTQAKRQDILISAFKKLSKTKTAVDWKLVLAGGTEIGASEYILKLKKKSEGYPIEIIESPPFSQIKELFGKAKIFWSASGFGIDEEKDPDKVEHFGIAVVEAMAAKAIPVVYAAGGHKEIIQNKENGYLWKSTSQLVSKTNNLIDDQILMKDFSKTIIEHANKYSYVAFEKEINKTIK